MKLEQLYYFQQAAKYHSISVAAKRNYISQSSFSGAISRLEKELGKSLLKRTNNGVELTPFGDLVLSKVDKIFQAQAEITEAAGSSRSGGTVRVSCIPGIHYRVLLETIQRLLQKQPNILLSVSTAESREIASRVSLGYTDFGIVVKGNFLNSFRDLVYHPLFQDRYQLYVGNTSPLWNASEVSWEKVCLQRHIGFLDEFRKNNGGLMEVFDEQKQPEIAFWTDDLDSMKQMIAQTNYVALFPHFMGKGDNEVERIFKILLPTRNMPERPAQVALSHRMLDAMLDGGIALCDAGTGIGKTYAYLVAGTAFSRFRAASELAPRPILISTSSIALQNAVRDEYLPLLSDLLTADGMITEPLQAVIRKGKSHYVCDERLERRLEQIDLAKKNQAAVTALLLLREWLDADEAVHLSAYDRERVCVPQVCDCQRDNCRYRSFLEDCDTRQYLFQICNHNLLLADAIHRSSGRGPILPDACALIVDEAHKLPETARQMFGTTLEAGDIQSLIRNLRREKYLLASESLADMAGPLIKKMALPFEADRPFSQFAHLLTGPEQIMTVIGRQIYKLLTRPTQKLLARVYASTAMFNGSWPNMVFYTAEDKRGGTMLCATISDLTVQLRQTLWRQERPVILTSATLAVGKDFRRFKEETGLLTDSRVMESVSLSPFDYQQNCLLYLPRTPPHQKDGAYYDKLAEEIAALLETTQGHALALFTSYSAMSAVKERLQDQELAYPLFTMGRNAIHTTEQFKAHPGSVLLATGAAWEGFDFPGDCVSLLIIPRLPFPVPDALKEKERENHPTLRLFIRAVVVPEMQIKLKQGFGRAIRTETDTCVVAILDERAAKGRRYRGDVLAALPKMPITGSLEDVKRFIRGVKGLDYFREASA